MTGRPLGPSLGCFAMLLAGCATAPSGGVRTQATQTLAGVPVKITRISVPAASMYSNAQLAAGSVWAAAPSVFGHKTIRVDPKTYQVAELSRPFTAGFADLLVDEHALWFSDGMTKAFAGRGDLYRVDLDTNQVVATIEGVGAPFGSGDGAIWAYNLRTSVVSGIEMTTNEVSTHFVATGGSYNESFAFGDGSIWQFAHQGEVSAWQLANGAIPSSVVRRIDPRTGTVIAEIPIGPYVPSDRINYVAGAIWVLGERDTSGVGFATRIDVKTNQVTATIPLVRTVSGCVDHPQPKTPVFVAGGIWVSTFCTFVSRLPGVLLKIDLQTNRVADQLGVSNAYDRRTGQPVLAAGEGALWGFDGRSAVHFEF